MSKHFVNCELSLKICSNAPPMSSSVSILEEALEQALDLTDSLCVVLVNIKILICARTVTSTHFSRAQSSHYSAFLLDLLLGHFLPHLTCSFLCLESLCSHYSPTFISSRFFLWFGTHILFSGTHSPMRCMSLGQGLTKKKQKNRGM